MVKQYGTLYQDTRRALLETENPQDAGVLARMLICHVSGKSHAQFLADRDLYAGEAIVEGVENGLKRLLSGEPIAYILGQWEFYGLPMTVSPKVLIPRDDTCAVAELAIKQALFLDKDPRILDLCCGTGCIGLAVASRVKDAKVTLADVSQEALAVAKENTALNKLTGRVRCVQADALKPAFPFLGKFDLIVSNPPYITGQEMLELPVSVKDYEPHLALYGGEDGLDYYRRIFALWGKKLKSGGLFAVEIGEEQASAVCGFMQDCGFEPTVIKDYDGHDRIVAATAE